MICPHCHHTIPEQRVYLMSQRIPREEPLDGHMKSIAYVGGLIIVFLLALGFLVAIHHLG